MPDLSDDQRTVLEALMVEGATAAERTEAGLRESTDLHDVGRILRELENDFEEPLVGSDVDEASGTLAWIALFAADELLHPEP
jgi:hypothetical protein